jgi:16S rRNA (cytosine1402-N4)-methyltransferase
LLLSKNERVRATTPVERSEQTDGEDAAEKHVPVLLHETLEHLDLRPGHLYVDATAGGGGHLRAMLEKLDSDSADPGVARDELTLIGIDRDTSALDGLKGLQERNGKRLALQHANYEDIKEVLSNLGLSTVTGGILADLGVSSMQLDEGERGFSFLRDGPLDMRMDRTQFLTAERLINTYSEKDLADIIFKYGEERFSRQIAREIVRNRPLQTTGQLREVVSRSLRYQHKKFAGKGKSRSGTHDASHPATRTFQAIRIAVNNELGSLEKFLQDATAVLAPGARLVVITFHSLEDRVVKQFLRQAATECVCPPRQPVCTCHHKRELLIITRKPIVAAEKEVLANVRSRSAKLRSGRKL